MNHRRFPSAWSPFQKSRDRNYFSSSDHLKIFGNFPRLSGKTWALKKWEKPFTPKSISSEAVKFDQWEEGGHSLLDVIRLNSKNGFLSSSQSDDLRGQTFPFFYVFHQSVFLPTPKSISSETVKFEQWKVGGPSLLDVIRLNSENEFLSSSQSDDLQAERLPFLMFFILTCVLQVLEFANKILQNSTEHAWHALKIRFINPTDHACGRSLSDTRPSGILQLTYKCDWAPWVTEIRPDVVLKLEVCQRQSPRQFSLPWDQEVVPFEQEWCVGQPGHRDNCMNPIST